MANAISGGTFYAKLPRLLLSDLKLQISNLALSGVALLTFVEFVPRFR